MKKLVIFGIVLFLVALLLRLLFVVVFLDIDRPMSGDEGAYHGQGIAFANWEYEHNGERPPILGLTLAFFYRFLGEAPSLGRFVNILISALSVPAILWVSFAISRSRYVAVGMALIWAVYPPSIWYSGWILTETISSLLVLFYLGAVFTFSGRPTLVHSLLLGAMGGLLILNRSVFILLPFAVLSFHLVAQRFALVPRCSPFKYLVSLAVFAIVISPWVWENYDTYSKFIPHSTQGGSLLLMSNGNLRHPEIQAGKYFKDPELLKQVSNMNPNNDAEIDSISRSIAINAIMEDPSLLPKPLVNRFRNFWTARPDPYDPLWTFNDTIMVVIWIPVLVMALVGFFCVRWERVWPMWLFLIYSSLMVLPFWGIPRFRFPVDHIVILMACYGTVAMWWYLQERLMGYPYIGSILRRFDLECELPSSLK